MHFYISDAGTHFLKSVFFFDMVSVPSCHLNAETRNEPLVKISTIQYKNFTFELYFAQKLYQIYYSFIVQFPKGRFISIVFHAYGDVRCFIWIVLNSLFPQ